jgi:hypothetical protein
LKHITFGLFKAHDTNGATMVMKLKQFLASFHSHKKKLAHVKDEGSNLEIYDQALKLVVSCGDLGITKPFDSFCYEHALSKVCQYATSYDKVVHGLHYPSIKYA